MRDKADTGYKLGFNVKGSAMNHRNTLIIITCCLLLASCASWRTGQHRAMCRTLKSSIIFNGATVSARQADIERAERPLQQSNYDRDCT
jgi:hypothetical protein